MTNRNHVTRLSLLRGCMQNRIALLLVLAVLIVTGISNAQNSNRTCCNSALRGMKKMFVDAGDDSESRRNIIEVIGKEFPEIIIVGQRQEAEILISYSHRVKRRDGVAERRVETKVEALTGPNQYRHVSDYTWSLSGCGLKRDARRFARYFIDIYEACNR